MAKSTTIALSFPPEVQDHYETEARDIMMPVEGLIGIVMTREAVMDGKLAEGAYPSGQEHLAAIANLLEEHELSREQMVEVALLIRGLSNYATTAMVPLPPVETLDLGLDIQAA